MLGGSKLSGTGCIAGIPSMQIILSKGKAGVKWGAEAILSANVQGFCVHISEDESELDTIQRAARKISAQGVARVMLSGEGWTLDAQWAFALGYLKARDSGKLSWADSPPEVIEQLQQRLRVHNWVRDSVNAMPEAQPPLKLAQDAADFIAELAPGSVSYEIISGEDLNKQQWAGVYGVGRGSDRPPAILRLEYCPASCKDEPVAAALVGKGLIYDSGGYSIKHTEHMYFMKSDMGGAATVTGALALAIARGLQKRIVLILCCAENLISGHAYKAGDILTYKNGTTVEVVNTDAEGRLVLADGLLMAAESGAKLVIDAATLTGAAVTALGADYNAIFAIDKPLQQRAMAYAHQENERHWPLPLEKFHQQKCPSYYADTANSRPVPGGGPGGALNAAGFLSRFAPNGGKGWLHFDLSGAFHVHDDVRYAAGATALGVRTMARTLLEES